VSRIRQRADDEARAARKAEKAASEAQKRAATEADRLASERAAIETYFEIAPDALVAGHAEIVEHPEVGAVLHKGRKFSEMRNVAEVKAAHAAAPRSARRLLARVWKRAVDAADTAARAVSADGLFGGWRTAFEAVRTAFLRAQASEERPGGRGLPSGTPMEQALVVMASAAADDDPELGRDVRRAVQSAQRRRDGQAPVLPQELVRARSADRER
jgi:hypothetical protein